MLTIFYILDLSFKPISHWAVTVGDRMVNGKQEGVSKMSQNLQKYKYPFKKTTFVSHSFCIKVGIEYTGMAMWK